MGEEENRYDELFQHVFRQLGVPDAAADLVGVAEALRDPGFGLPVGVRMPLPPGEVKRRSTVIAAWKGLVDSIEPSMGVARVFASTPMLQDDDLADRFLMLCATASPISATRVAGDELTWTETSPWPVAFAAFLGQLAIIAHVHRIAIEQRRAQLPVGAVLSEFPRLMPTRFHYAAASLGAWVGGALNVQYFSLFASGPQLADGDVNRGYAKEMGYGAKEADAFTDSGIVAIPGTLASPLLAAQEPGDVPVFGSIPVNEFNPANPPANRDKHSHVKPGGLILDSYYRAPFLAPQVEGLALYGEHDVLRDHYDDFYRSLEIESLLRCKHYCAPVVRVSSLAEIREVVGRIPKRSDPGLRFRGQARLYHLKRDDAVKRLLFGSSTALEPSLTTSASRGGHDYDRTHFLLKHFLTERVFLRSQALGDPALIERWRQASASGACELDYALIAFAQHYGLPSHGLDVSSDLEVAAWFATHLLEVDGVVASYRPREEAGWSKRPKDSPVILVHQTVTHSVAASLQDCQLLEEFDLEAKRPVRQAAQFFFGGHSDHRNRLAETVVCVLRLEPGDYRTVHTFDDLFPPPEVDVGYRVMLDFSAWAGSDEYPVLRFA